MHTLYLHGVHVVIMCSRKCSDKDNIFCCDSFTKNILKEIDM